MRRKLQYLTLLCTGVLCLQSFTEENPFMRVTEQDVQLRIPAGFPKPAYDFSRNKATPAGFILGRLLFYDPILSRDSSTSCASCHQQFAAFAHIDHPLSHGINGLIGKRNVPAIQNGIWQTSFMWDGGVSHIELQPVAPITSAVEMDQQLKEVVQKLAASDRYRAAFRQAFGDTSINSERLLKALTQFTGLMISADARYDRYLQGKDTFSLMEKEGLRLFTLNCAGCHRPPLFTDNTFRNTGLALDTALKDSGRAAITGRPGDYMKFRVPSLRHVALTYPYGHDGRFRTLETVLAHYAHPAGNREPTDRLIGKGIALSAEDRKALIAFLNTLNDKTFLYDRRFADPFYGQ